MIAPSSRLLLLAALGPGPLAVVVALAPEWTPLYGVAVLGGVLLAAVDAALSLSRLRNIQLELPPLSRLWKDRDDEIQITLKRPGEPDNALSLELALALPQSFESPGDYQVLQLPAAASVVFPWPLTPRRRGRFFLQLAALRGLSRLGFWTLHRRIKLEAVLQVYPNILQDRKTLAGIFLNRENAGVRKHRQIGQGREFERLRDYLPGDSLRDIHWRTTAKRGRPVTKEYQIERTQEVYLIVDASRLSTRMVEAPGQGGGTENVLEHYLRAALILGMVAQRQGDLFGLSVFADRVQTFLRASGGAEHFNACREAIYQTEPRRVSPDYRELFTFLRLRLRRRALLFFLTDLEDPVLAEEFTSHIHLLSRRHLVVTAMVQPPGARPAFTGLPVTKETEIHQRLSGHLQWRDLRALERELQRQGAGFGLLPRAHMSLQLVSRYTDIKQRQLL